MACFEEDKLVRTVSVVCTDLVNLVAWKGVWIACPSGGWCVTLAPWPLGLWCSLTAGAVDWIKWPHGSRVGCLFSREAAPTCVPHSARDVQCVLCSFLPVGGGQEAGKVSGG